MAMEHWFSERSEKNMEKEVKEDDDNVRLEGVLR